jgi:hypothetical protein
MHSKPMDNLIELRSHRFFLFFLRTFCAFCVPLLLSKPRSVILFRMIDRVAGNLYGQVFLRNKGLAA